MASNIDFSISYFVVRPGGGNSMTGILYPYNAEAYKAAAAMLDGCGKAAVVHPTGTGKSFIGFQLCRDHLAAKICWLSPSEYIFRTQLEIKWYP